MMIHGARSLPAAPRLNRKNRSRAPAFQALPELQRRLAVAKRLDCARFIAALGAGGLFRVPRSALRPQSPHSSTAFTLTTSPISHSARTEKGRQQTSQSVVNRWLVMVA